MKSVVKWLRDERSSILTETSLMVGFAVLVGLALLTLGSGKIKSFAETVFGKLDEAQDQSGFGWQ
ncbi:MAG: hypothetical protein K6U74_14405 [Firmicutes bacterium]|nr:hypothetical protein [Bacillota bacterium]